MPVCFDGADDMANNALWLEGWTVHVLDRSGEKTVAEATYDHGMMSCPKCGSVRPPYKHGPHCGEAGRGSPPRCTHEGAEGRKGKGEKESPKGPGIAAHAAGEAVSDEAHDA